jgi:hypothetical protein
VTLLFHLALAEVLALGAAALLLKGRGWLFIACLVIGVVPTVGVPASDLIVVVGAVSLALPSSYWARWFYRGGREDRRLAAQRRYPDAPTWPRLRYIAAAAFALFVAAIGPVVAATDPSALT